MTGPGFVICEADKVKAQFPEFQRTLQELEARVLENTKGVWPGLTFGGLTPREKQFGRTTILPEVFADEAGDVLDSAHTIDWWGRDNFRIYYTATSPAAAAVPGWKTILQGGGTPVGVTPEDVRIAWCGLAFASKTQNISKIRFEIGDTRYPKMDIEEIHVYNKPAIIFEEGFEIPEETRFLLRGWFEATGYQRVIPLGFLYYRRKDIVLTE